ncbi:MAG: zinc-binding alcohol dehydrogenase family protein [Kiritimatiellae bacterium]|nr:zinc-binding alcohol dehydrogenase family protein [Kiritimatiellia bacterium]
MKTIHISGVRQMVVTDEAKPVAGAGEVLLKLQYVGFCGSDLNTWLGRNTMAKANVIPGHEIGATIEALGDGCPAALAVGQTVTVNPYTNCGTCPSCRNLRANACQHNETLGVQRDGAMREYIALPWQKVIPVDGLAPRDAALIEPMSVGFHAVARAQVTDNDVVLVFGCGMVGLGAVVRAARRGATVVAVDLSPEKLALAAALGARYGIDSARENVVDRIREITGGAGADVVIEAVGSPATYVSAIDTVSFTGRVVCIGYAKSEIAFQTKYFVQKELDIRGSRNATPDDFRAVIRYLRTARAPLDRLVSGVVTPDEAPAAMEKWAAAPGQVFRILVKWH